LVLLLVLLLPLRLVLGTVRPLHSNQRWVPLPVPLTIYSVFSTMIPRANSPPGRRALRLDPQRGGALTQPDGLAGPRNDSSYPAYEPVPNAPFFVFSTQNSTAL
jgi:hypothetical protein